MACKVYLIGAGLGNPDMLTARARHAMESADVLIGARRLLEPYKGFPAEKLELTRSDDIVEALRGSKAALACVLLSGDVGFYSGATLLREKLAGYDVESIPGISSLVYFCARIGIPWQDVRLVSAHGRDCNVAGEVQSHARTFMLTGGSTKIGDACKTLVEAGLGGLRVWVGERLSYEDETVACATALEFAEAEFSDLAVMLVENEHPVIRENRASSIPDAAFARGDAPMTKEEVRALAIAKLRLREDSTVWDVGAGTGSVSVEAALAANKGSVFAIEKKPDALALLEENKKRFGVTNLRVLLGSAPEACVDLPSPDRVFIGGSSGKLASIIELAVEKSPSVRLCITAITLETLAEALSSIERFSLGDVDITQVFVAKAKNVASYHMMNALNPVYIVSAEAQGGKVGQL